jgi:hypothetical protein
MQWDRFSSYYQFEVKTKRENLHQKTSDGYTFMTLIMKKVWPKEDLKSIQTIGSCSP